ncbi:MAG: polyprenyl synthetase family protein, partial [Oscillospiraceae bacterium]|nr:polyprenyl synthetase family protein [Oscillospiraceae bacterium]
RSLSRAAGLRGICGGQALDIAAEGKEPTLQELTEIHKRKTAALIIAACEIGVYYADGSPEQLKAARAYGEALGLAFQIQDDVLDVTSTEEELGKPIGSDKDNHKFTFVNLYGLDRCREIIEEETSLACNSLEDAFNDVSFLSWLARYLSGRTK